MVTSGQRPADRVPGQDEFPLCPRGAAHTTRIILGAVQRRQSAPHLGVESNAKGVGVGVAVARDPDAHAAYPATLGLSPT
jgi:hypothetical protein